MDGLPQAVVWDVDGVLLDSEPLHDEAARAAIAGSGIVLDARDTGALLGRPLPEVWSYLSERGLATPREAFIARVEAHYLAGLRADMARPDVRRLVAALDRRGIPQCCVSSGERRLVEANLSAVGVAATVRFALAREDVRRTKPDPEPYRTACARLGLAPADCLAVEDTPVGVRSASAAGLRVVAWPHALSAQCDFPGAFRRIERLADLPAFARLLEATAA